MGDQQVWDQGLQGVKKLLAELPYANMMQLSDLLNDYRREKKALADVILQINSEVICRKCSGLCCLNGKYRINVLDLIALVVDGTLITPDFEQKPICPYGALSGCLMEPGFRACQSFCVNGFFGLLQNRHSVFKNYAELI